MSKDKQNRETKDNAEKKKKEKSAGSHQYAKLREKHESDLTKRERRLLEKEKLKEMGLGKKLEYIWMYYKPVIFGIIGFIALIFLAVDLYQNAQKETLLSISVVNAGNMDAEVLASEVQDIIGAEGKNELAEVVGNLLTGPEGDSFDYYTQMAFVTQMQAKTMDVMVMPEKLYKALNEEGYFVDLKELLGDEVYQSFGEDIDQGHVSLAGSPLTEKFDLQYEPVCVAVLVNSTHMDNAAKWIASLAE